MRDKIIRILWSEPAPLDLAMSMIGSQQPGLYYITKDIVCQGAYKKLG